MSLAANESSSVGKISPVVGLTGGGPADLATHRTIWISGSASWTTLRPMCFQKAVSLICVQNECLRMCHLTSFSLSVFQKCRVQELQCPRGLQEAEFLDLLGSTFPQLASRTPFDVFTSDRSRRLQPLNVTTRTAEEIIRSIRQAGAGNSALYIRLKVLHLQLETGVHSDPSGVTNV